MDPAWQARAAAVRLAIFDVDGVLTDGTLWFGDAGEQMKGFHVRDGHGLRMLQDSGVALALLTGRRSVCVERRAAELGIAHVLQGVEHKAEGFARLLSATGLEAPQTAYMGDDVVDLPVMIRCGLAATVPEAPQVVRDRAHYVTRAGGGRGAVRELCERIMEAQGTLDARLARYLS